MIPEARWFLLGDRHGLARNAARVALASFLFAGPAAIGAEIAPENLAFFESKVRPLLIERCYECHGEKKQKGGLRLDSRAGWQMGGDTGPALLPGQPHESLIIKAVRQLDPDLQMPPKTKLAESEIETLVTWVKMGAPDPRTGAVAKRSAGLSLEEGRKHWAYQPIARPSPPMVQDAEWPRGAIDRFVLARLEANHLRPAAEASRHSANNGQVTAVTV